MHISETAYSIMQLLPWTYQLPGESVSVKELLVMYCAQDSSAIATYMRELAPDPLLGRGLFVSLCVLAPFLNDATIHELFTRQCALLRACLVITPLVKTLLKGVQATVWGLQKEIPSQAKPYFQTLEDDQVHRDLPISFSLPHREDIKKLLSSSEDLDGLGVRLSVLVAKWASLSGSTS